MENNLDSVFISYRRKDSKHPALLVFKDLQANGYDAFIDYEGIDSGNFGQIILNQIASRRHFVLVLSPGCLDRVVNPDDWLRREIEYALEMERNIVPLFFDGFEFESAKKYLTGKLSELSNHNAVTVPDGYFDEAMKKLRNRFLKQPLKGAVRPAPKSDNSFVQEILQRANEAVEQETDQLANTTPSPEPTSLRTTSTGKEGRLTIIVPLYNEAYIIGELVRGLRAENLIDRYKVILCDDGSTDNTFEVMKKYEKGTKNLRCIQNKFNERKVGAIYNMAIAAQTKFVLTLDADCVLSELTNDALERLMDKMEIEDVSATCFRITPHDRGVLSKLQKIDYTIFTDSIRRILGVPVCLIGQGVLWKTESLLTVLSYHSGAFDGDDLENTVIALQKGMNIYWEHQTILLKTEAKRTLLGLIQQRALSWDFGMFRVLFKKSALSLGGNSGAFYKNLLLLDFFAHPLKIVAIPLLFSVPILNFMGFSFFENGFSSIYREAIFISFKFGSYGVIAIWLLTVANVLFCFRKDLASVIKWSIFSAAYLSSPFVYTLYYPLLYNQYLNAYDVLGASIHWLGAGLIITYLWWVLLTYFLILVSSLDRRAKGDLALVAFLSPMYYFLLLVVSRTIAIMKYLTALLGRKLPI